MSRTLETPSLAIHHSTGEEGPKYDPYHYDEIEVTHKQEKWVLTLHSGLSCSLKLQKAGSKQRKTRELTKNVTKE